MSVSLTRFVDESYQITGHLIEVPHLGAAGIGALRENGIHSTYQLFAYFLDCERDQELFSKFLNESDVPARHVNEIAQAVSRRVGEVGIKLAVEIPDSIVQSSRVTDDQMDAFLARRFNGLLEHDLQKMGMGTPGKPSASVANLARANITSTDKLFAAFLKKFDGPIEAASAEKAAEFYRELKDKNIYGVAAGYSATIVDALKNQLDIGIDKMARRRAQGAIPEEPNSPPGTEERVRRRGVTRTSNDPQPAPPLSTPSPPSPLGSRIALLLVALGVGAVVAYQSLIAASPPALDAPAPGEWL